METNISIETLKEMTIGQIKKITEDTSSNE